jgi:HD-GYP domain-containing protein (c-di-GMP phosphodiesterase class II)
LGHAGLLPDIGKIRIPRDLLARPGKLSQAEEEIVRRHTVYGARILRELPGLLRLAMVVAFEHHANYNLSGYPQITVKEVPHLLSRIVQVADIFDATTSSRRAYRRPKRLGEALKVILDGAGTIFDPVLAKLSVRVLADLSRDAGRNSSSHD